MLSNGRGRGITFTPHSDYRPPQVYSAAPPTFTNPSPLSYTEPPSALSHVSPGGSPRVLRVGGNLLYADDTAPPCPLDSPAVSRPSPDVHHDAAQVVRSLAAPPQAARELQPAPAAEAERGRSESRLGAESGRGRLRWQPAPIVEPSTLVPSTPAKPEASHRLVTPQVHPLVSPGASLAVPIVPEGASGGADTGLRATFRTGMVHGLRRRFSDAQYGAYLSGSPANQKAKRELMSSKGSDIDSLEAAHEEEVSHFAKFQAIDFWEPSNAESRRYARSTHGHFAGCKWVLFAFIGVWVGMVAVTMKQSVEYGVFKRLGWVEDIIYDDAPPCIKGGAASHSRRMRALEIEEAGELEADDVWWGSADRRGRSLSGGGHKYQAKNCTAAELEWEPSTSNKVKAAAVWIGSSVLLITAGAALPVFVEVNAAGSGLPQVMAYLNGVSIPQILTLRVMVVKFVSCLLSVVSGLPVGPEGPMVHMGAIVGTQWTKAHLLTSWCGLGGRNAVLRYVERAMVNFGKMQQQRDFITCGAAAGVAAAFGAPVGGLLFVMEEIASSWSPALTWRIFFATTCAFFVVALFNSVVHAWELTGTKFGAFSENAQILFHPELVLSRIDMNIFIVVPSACLGVICGVLAVLFTKVNLAVFRWRKRVIVPRKPLRVLEPALIALVYSSLTFIVPLLVADISGCDSVPSAAAATTANTTLRRASAEAASGSGSGAGGAGCLYEAQSPSFVYFVCGRDGATGNYSTMATLSFNSGETIVKHLLSMGTRGQYTPGSLLIFLALYASFAAYGAGSAFATGLVIPFLVVGSVTGRLFAEVADKVWDGTKDYDWFDPGVFALMGAGAFFGGVSRLTVSLAVIMVELSNQLFFLPPMMLAILIAKWVADRYAKEALYHGLIHELGMAHLDPMGDQSSALIGRTAKHLMTHPVVVLREREHRGSVVDALSTDHNGFPVVDNNTGHLRGILLRHQLVPHAVGTPGDIVQLHTDMSTSPFTVHERFDANLTYLSFQTVGVRHLVVVNDDLQVVGIITRKDLAAALKHADLHTDEHGFVVDMIDMTKGLGKGVLLVGRGVAEGAAHITHQGVAVTQKGMAVLSPHSPTFFKRQSVAGVQNTSGVPNPSGGRSSPLLSQPVDGHA